MDACVRGGFVAIPIDSGVISGCDGQLLVQTQFIFDEQFFYGKEYRLLVHWIDLFFLE